MNDFFIFSVTVFVLVSFVLIRFQQQQLPSSGRDQPIPVPSRYHHQKNAFIHHQFPRNVKIGGSNSDRVFVDEENTLHVKGFRSTNFDGRVELHTVTDSQKQTKILEVPAWTMRENSRPIDHLFISVGENKALRLVSERYGIEITRPKFAGALDDVWLRDEFQVGYIDNYTYIMNGPRNNPLDNWIESYCRNNKNLHHFHLEQSCIGSSYDFFGNLICLSQHKIAYGMNPETGIGMCTRILDFIRNQKKQDLVPVRTDWLAVGHVDEIICMMPGDKLAIVSPGLAVKQLLALEPDTPIMLADEVSTVGEVLDKFANYNLWIEDEMLKEVKQTLNPTVSLPVLFWPNEEGKADALTYNLVNVIVDPRFMIVPTDNGPIVNGALRWGLPLWNHHFPNTDIYQVDSSSFHHLLGGLHCASNEVRS
jgi:hypothetical protein